MAQITITTKSDSEAVWWMELANKMGTEIQVVFGSNCPADGDNPSSAPLQNRKRKYEQSKFKPPGQC
ncbi:MAG: hypothetical protein ACOVQ4_13045 [Flectobacillus sp.]|uniref:hypothetical protein n=1 Tax=Flectobacillus sp. TaxID=50419 RepID=UPI003B9BB463